MGFLLEGVLLAEDLLVFEGTRFFLEARVFVRFFGTLLSGGRDLTIDLREVLKSEKIITIKRIKKTRTRTNNMYFNASPPFLKDNTINIPQKLE